MESCVLKGFFQLGGPRDDGVVVQRLNDDEEVEIYGAAELERI